MTKSEIESILLKIGADPAKPIWQLTTLEYVELIVSFQQAPPELKTDEEIYMTTQEVMLYLKVSKSTVGRWIKQNYIPAQKKGGILRFKKSELDKILNQQLKK